MNLAISHRRLFASFRNAHIAATGAAVVILIGLALVVQTVSISFVTHIPLPQLDEWYNLNVLRNILAGGDTAGLLFGQHNEHRIFFPRFILFSDFMFFKGMGILNLITIVIVQSLQACLFIYLLATSYPPTAPVRSAVLGTISTVLLFTLLQSENFAWGFQVQFVGVFAAASLAITLFSKALSRQRLGQRSTIWISASFCLAIIASFSMSNGLVAGPVLIFMAAVARAPRICVLSAIALTGSVTILFFMGYTTGDIHGPSGPLLNRAAAVLEYTCAYLGNVLDPDISATIVLGACGLAVTAVIGLRFALGRDSHPGRLALLGIALFAAGSAFMTAFGRSANGIEGAMASRYVTGTACFWCAVLIGSWSWSAELKRPIVLRLPIGIAALILLVTAVEFQPTGVTILEERRYNYNIIEDALLQNLYDKAFLSGMDESPDIMRELTPMLRARKLSIFAGKDSRLWGRPLSEAGPIDEEPCGGTFAEARSSAALGPNGVDVHGTVTLRPAFGSSRRIYLVDPNRTIVGFASTPFRSGEWTGYATVPVNTPVQAFARRGSGRLCLVGSTIVAAQAAGDDPDTSSAAYRYAT